jgi:hypothetical protein
MSTSQVIIGSTLLRVGSVGVSISGDYELDATGVPWLKNEVWDMEIKLLAEEGNLDNQIRNLELALISLPDKIGVLKDGNPTAHYVHISETLGGIRPVRPPSYNRFQQGELVTYRSVTASFMLTKPLYVSPYQIVEFNETVPQVRAARTLAVLQPNFGRAVVQQIRQYQHSKVTQTGTVVYARAYGPIPPPLFNVGQVGPPQITPRSPRKIGHGQYAAEVAFPIDYTYEFVSPYSLSALPTYWIS